MKKTPFPILLCWVIVLGLTECGNSSVDDAKSDLQENQEKYGSVEKNCWCLSCKI